MASGVEVLRYLKPFEGVFLVITHDAVINGKCGLSFIIMGKRLSY